MELGETELSDRAKYLRGYIIARFNGLQVARDVEEMADLRLKMAYDVAHQMEQITGKKVDVLTGKNFDAWVNKITND